MLRRVPLDRLKEHAAAALVLVQAPAGFGKTTLLRQYSEYRASRGDRIAWIRMDAHSADPAQFLRLLCDAVDGFDENLRQRKARLDPRPPTIQDFTRALRRLRGGGLIVVDNFEQAFTVGLEGVFMQVVRVLPDGVQLCIGSRVLPTERLVGLKMREQVIVIDENDLRFRPAESAEFFREFPNLSAAEIDEIQRSTDGWPAALQCFRLCLRRGSRQRSLAYAGKGMTSDLIDFLATDVLEHLDVQMQAALSELCVPEKLNAALVEHLTGCEDGQARLAEIERAGLFLSHIDLEGHWFRFHNLFRQVLLARMRRETSETELRRRHHRIADWYAANGYREEAIQHCIDAGDPERAAELLDSVIDRLVAQERLGLLERYADALPSELLLSYENLANAAIIAYGFRRAFDKANRLIDARAQHLEGSRDARALGLHNYARLFVLAAEDRIDELGRAAEEAGKQFNERDGFQYAVTFNARAMWLVGRSEFEEARSLLLRAKPLHERDGSLFGQAYQEAIYGMALSAEGRIGDAVRGLGAALRHTEEEASGSVTAGSVLAVYLADGHYEQNRLAEAEALLDDYGQLAEQQAIVDPLGVMFLTQSRIAFARGDTAGAESALDRALYLGYQHGFARLVSYAQAERVRLATLSGDLDLAERRVRELDPQRLSGDVDLMFHAGEAEAHTVTLARFLIRTGRCAEARTMLQADIRRARQQRRRRRELKLTLMLALAQNAEGKTNLARRSLLDALELGMPQEFVRSFIDERQPALQLMKETRRAFDQLPALAHRDALIAYLDHLLAEAGESAATSAPSADAGGVSPQLLESLTEKERNLLRYVSLGLSNKDLADRLSVSTNTVKWHLRNIFEKLQISNRVQAIALARHLGLID
ncbi:MAG: LuxR C-terminal-related transcriptional regulator [Gammaproteobacteria bacterium]